MNGFEKFNINHLSASSINLWSNAADVWVAKYLLKKSTPFGPAATRGQAVETAVVSMLMGDTEAEALAKAYKQFDRKWLIGTEESTKERDLIAPMAAVAVEELAEYGKPEFTAGTDQEKININANFGDWSIPIWGFLDMVFPKHGLVVDLKSTTRVPSTMSADHQLQRAIYHRAKGNHAVKFLYVSSKKAAWLEDGDPVAVLSKAKAQIARMETFLRHCPNAETAAAIIPVNQSSFYWRGAEPLRSEIYGL